MHVAPVTVPAQGSLPDVLHLLVVAGISGVPVVASSGVVVGVLSSSDVLRAIEHALDEDRDEGEPDDLSESLHAITAGDMATPEVIWVDPETPVAQVAQIMRREGIHRVLVGSSERLEGILTAYDLLRAV
jgi:CBS domain-containing protein